MWTAPKNLQACSVLHAFACHTPVSRFLGDSKSINFCAQTCTLWPYCLLRVRKDAQYHVGEDGPMYVSHSLSLSLSFSLFYSLNVVSEAPPHIECQKKLCVANRSLSSGLTHVRPSSSCVTSWFMESIRNPVIQCITLLDRG